MTCELVVFVNDKPVRSWDEYKGTAIQVGPCDTYLGMPEGTRELPDWKEVATAYPDRFIDPAVIDTRLSPGDRVRIELRRPGEPAFVHTPVFVVTQPRDRGSIVQAILIRHT